MLKVADFEGLGSIGPRRCLANAQSIRLAVVYTDVVS
jgi:hypothetical protein